MDEKIKVAFLGLGAMGARMAARCVDVVELAVWSRSGQGVEALVARGARAAASPKDAAQGADLVISMVTDDEASQQVWTHPERGALLGLAQGAAAIECSTLSIDWIAALAGLVAERGAQLLDAPVVGSTPQAELGQLVFLVGAGDEASRARAWPLLELMGQRCVHVGGLGQGALMKLVVNALFAVQVATIAELLGALGAHGAEPANALEILASLPVTSPAVVGAGRLMLAQDHAPRFPVRLVHKDLVYAQRLAHMPLVEAAQRRFAQSVARGDQSLNLTAVHLLRG